MLKLETAIIAKFDDLADKAKKVSASQQVTDVAAFVDSRKFQDWATSSLSLLQKVFGENSTYHLNFQGIYSKIINIAYKESFDRCRAIVQAAREEYEGGGLTDIALFLDHAVLEFLAGKTSEYLRREEKETACLLAMVLLEHALLKICRDKGIAGGSVDEMNEALHQQKAYQIGTYQRIQDWCYMKEDFRHCDGEKYKTAEVEEMLRGVQKFISRELGD
jgi:hypothetical protein